MKNAVAAACATPAAPAVSDVADFALATPPCATDPAATNSALVDPAAANSLATANDSRTSDRIVTLLLERGGLTAVELSHELGLAAAGVRRHLDVLQAHGRVVASEQNQRGPRGRGRPAKVFTLTEAGRARFRHTYDDLASAALRYLAETAGSRAVADFAASQVAALEERCRVAMEDAGDDPLARAEALAKALSAQGYAASASAIASGGQLCQHHCPVAQVAAEFPQLCEAETAAIGRLVGSHVQRLATISHGDGVCTTYIPGAANPVPGTSPGSTSQTAGTASSSTTPSGGTTA